MVDLSDRWQGFLASHAQAHPNMAAVVAKADKSGRDPHDVVFVSLAEGPSSLRPMPVLWFATTSTPPALEAVQ